MSEKDQIELKPKVKAAAAPEAPLAEDSGSQALSEALQSSFSIVKFLMIGLVLVFICSGFFIVDSGQQAIILRLGKPVGEGQAALLGPGPHWAFPRPIDEKKIVSIGQNQTAVSTVGWYATTPEAEALKQENPAGATLNPAVDGYTLTSDANIIHVRATLHYRITDPIGYLFDFVNAGEFVTNALNNSIFYATAHFTVDDILTVQSAAFSEAVTSHMRELIQEQKLGIEIDPITVEHIPPRQLKAKFEEVLQASLNSQEILSKAQSETNNTLSKARAEAQARINTAQHERDRLVAQLEAEAKDFAAMLPEYKANPDLFIKKRQTEALGRIYEGVRETHYLPPNMDQLRLLLNRDPNNELKLKTPSPAAP